MDLSDPLQIGLILVVTGILGIAGGNVKAGILELSMTSTKGKFTVLAMLVVIVGLMLIVFDYFFFLEQP
jgi:hypothetical protein